MYQETTEKQSYSYLSLALWAWQNIKSNMIWTVIFITPINVSSKNMITRICAGNISRHTLADLLKWPQGFPLWNDIILKVSFTIIHPCHTLEKKKQCVENINFFLIQTKDLEKNNSPNHTLERIQLR